MFLAKKSEFPNVPKADALSTALRINGIYHEASTGKSVDWKIHRTPQALTTFILIGFLAGMFGLGAGWANVPVLNLMMGAPLKISVATSKFLLSITDTSAAWIYVNNGAVLPMLANSVKPLSIVCCSCCNCTRKVCSNNSVGSPQCLSIFPAER